MKKTTETGKFYYFFPQTVAMVGVSKNIMPAAWHTPISAQPPLYGVLISPKRHTYELLQKENGFTISFFEHSFAELSAQTGSTSGRNIDKLEKFNVRSSPAEKVNGPLPDQAYAIYECEKQGAHEYGDHYLFVGRIVLLHFRADIVTPEKIINEQSIKPMLYFGKDRYITTDPTSLSIFERK